MEGVPFLPPQMAPPLQLKNRNKRAKNILINGCLLTPRCDALGASLMMTIKKVTLKYSAAEGDFHKETKINKKDADHESQNDTYTAHQFLTSVSL